MQLNTNKAIIKNLPYQMGRFLIDAVFPEKCYGCSAYGSYICTQCAENSLSPHSICPHCKKRLPFGDLQNECKANILINRIFTCSDYKNTVVSAAIKDLKYRSAYKVAEPLADMACQWITEQDLFIDIVSQDIVIIPVPSYIKKEKKRGFNPAEKIASHIAERLGSKMYASILIKHKDTKAQVKTTSKKERMKNLKGAFAITDKNKIKGRTILVVDDVITTGSTMRECSLTLKKAGAKEVWGLAIARD